MAFMAFMVPALATADDLRGSGAYSAYLQTIDSDDYTTHEGEITAVKSDESIIINGFCGSLEPLTFTFVKNDKLQAKNQVYKDDFVYSAFGFDGKTDYGVLNASYSEVDDTATITFTDPMWVAYSKTLSASYLSGTLTTVTIHWSDEASIALIKPEEADAEYFTLQGMRVSNPSAPGIYILRKGALIEKIRK